MQAGKITTYSHLYATICLYNMDLSHSKEASVLDYVVTHVYYTNQETRETYFIHVVLKEDGSFTGQESSRPENHPATATVPPVKDAHVQDDGFILPVTSYSQFHDLGFKVRNIENGKNQEGPHATLLAALDSDKSEPREYFVREGQTLKVSGYRIRVEKIEVMGSGSVQLRIWELSKKSWRFWE